MPSGVERGTTAPVPPFSTNASSSHRMMASLSESVSGSTRSTLMDAASMSLPVK